MNKPTIPTRVKLWPPTWFSVIAGAEGWEFLSRCEGPEETAALAVCQKHWALAKDAKAAGDSSKFVDSRNEVEQKANFLADCAFDVCAGGETAAQLAADLLNFE